MLNFNKKIYSNITYLGYASEFTDDIIENIEQISLLQTFGLEEIKVLCHYLHCYAAPRGYFLFEEGHQADHLILVLSGGVSVTEKNVKDNTDETVEFLVGATLGESNLVDQQIWNVSCLTTVPTDFAVLSRESLNEMLVNHPRLGNKFLLAIMQNMAFRLRHSIDNMALQAPLGIATPL